MDFIFYKCVQIIICPCDILLYPSDAFIKNSYYMATNIHPSPSLGISFFLLHLTLERE
jgi:hypothetical protein